MVKQFLASFRLVFVLLSFAPSTLGASYSYTDVTVAGAGDTILNGINNAGTVVGIYATNIDVTQPIQPGWTAFMRNGQSVTTLQVPFNPLGAEADSINNGGVVVGTYLFQQGSNQNTHGFVFDGSSYKDIAYPGGFDTAISDIDDNGVIVGFYSDDFGLGVSIATYGFRGTPNGSGGYNFETVDLSDGDLAVENTFLNGRNQSGKEVATFVKQPIGGDTQVYGVLLPQRIHVQSPNSTTTLSDINNNGVIVGRATFANPDERLYETGFMVSSSELLTLPANQVNFMDLHLPGSACTFGKTQVGVEPNCHKVVQQINDNGAIVGFYDNGDGVFRGFIGTQVAGVLGDYNGNGKVDGADYVLWRKGGPLQNEGDDPNNVNQGDYTYWRSRFGATSGSGDAIVGSAVPEPNSLVLGIGLLMIAVATNIQSRRAGSRDSQYFRTVGHGQ